MNSIGILWKKYRYHLSLCTIVLLSIVLRFYNFNERFGLAYDQAHGAIISRYALFNLKLPLLGPFSSAGPYQTGGEWYWFIMIGTLLNPWYAYSPWIFLLITYVLFVIFMAYLGSVLVDKWFGLLVALFTAISTAQITQGLNLANQSPLSLTTSGALLFSILFLKTKQTKYLFLSALFVGIGLSIHLQGMAVVILLLFTLLAYGIPRMRNLASVVFGVSIPWVPVLIADMQNNFANTINMYTYYTKDQYAISYEQLGRRWLTYLGDFWPESWGFIIGGNTYISLLVILLGGWIVAYCILRKRTDRIWIVLLLSFLGMVFLLRYIRTPLFESYLVFTHPFVLLFTAFVVYTCVKWKKYIGSLLLVVILTCTIARTYAEIQQATNYTLSNVEQWKNDLTTKYPNTQFALYDYKYKTTSKSAPLVLDLYTSGLIADNGLKVGVVIATSGASFTYPVVSGEKEGYQLLLLESATSAELTKDNWVFINPSRMYEQTQNWYEKN